MGRKSTKSKILDAAEKLFAEKGYEGTSIRAICSAARANVAAVHYHFGGKECVAEAIMERRMEVLSVRRKKLLDDLFSKNDTPTVRSLIGTLVLPLAELIDSKGNSGLAYVKMLAHLFNERPDLIWTVFMKYNSDNRTRQAEGIVRALPHISVEVLDRRQTLATAAALHWLANPIYFTMEGPDVIQRPGGTEIVSELIDFLAGGLSAPLTKVASNSVENKNSSE
ncbi:MAG: TetR/AcrR family transcriptional regulator [Chloroflexi bacterium]|nr:TetR/AcrR family transcriptional regulator [Chloroflexota bacterium]